MKLVLTWFHWPFPPLCHILSWGWRPVTGRGPRTPQLNPQWLLLSARHCWLQRNTHFSYGRFVSSSRCNHTRCCFTLELVLTDRYFQVDVAAVAPGRVAGLAHIFSWHAFGQVAQPQRALPLIWKDITIHTCWTACSLLKFIIFTRWNNESFTTNINI